MANELPRTVSDRYRLERTIGEGGMAVVYLATDLRHGRSVALKMMREPVGGSFERERFLREISVTAQLDHPHVVPLLDSGSADDELFYVMPLVVGETLREKLMREKQLSLTAALKIADDVLGALEHAHARGVVHRDIKPENILLADGHARLADFGVARAIAAAGGTSLTGTGVALGTPSYMSPEQAAAERDVDRRSDVYAVGCVLYEMLVGQPPFSGPTLESVLHQHLVVPPRFVSQLRPSVPPAVSTVIERALAKAPADRQQTAAELASALTAAVSAPVSAAVPAVGAAPVEPASVRASASHGGRRFGTGGRWLLLAVGALAALVVWLALRTPAPASDPRPLIAVVPFRNMGSAEDAYFADGVTEEIITRLTRISGIRVLSRSTTARYSDTTRSLREIGRELGVQYILEGTIRAVRDASGTSQVRVAPTLVKTDDDTQLWTDSYTAGFAPSEIFAVQSRIAERVADALHVSLAAIEVASVRRAETADSAAYRAWLLGQYQLNRGNATAVREAITYFAQAIALDTHYVRPYAGLAAAYLQVPSYATMWISTEEALARADSAARRALALEPSSADAHAALGAVAEANWRWDEAVQQLRRAITLDPDNALAHDRLSRVLGNVGQSAASLTEAERAMALDPVSSSIRVQVATALAANGRTAQAAAQLREALRLDPTAILAKAVLAEFAGARGDIPAMADQLAQLPGLQAIGASLKAWSADPGKKPEVIGALEALRSPNRSLDEMRRGWLFANIGEPRRAVAALEQAVDARLPVAVSVLQFPTVNRALGADPRFQALRRRVGLPPLPSR